MYQCREINGNILASTVQDSSTLQCETARRSQCQCTGCHFWRSFTLRGVPSLGVRCTLIPAFYSVQSGMSICRTCTPTITVKLQSRMKQKVRLVLSSAISGYGVLLVRTTANTINPIAIIISTKLNIPRKRRERPHLIPISLA